MVGTTPKPVLDEQGAEIPDPTPIVLNIGSRPIGDFDRIREFIKREMSAAAASAGMETLEDANDFDVDDDLFPVSPHEYAEGTERADREALDAERSRRAAAARAAQNSGAVRLAPSRPGASAADQPVESSSEPPVQGGSAN